MIKKVIYRIILGLVVVYLGIFLTNITAHGLHLKGINSGGFCSGESAGFPFTFLEVGHEPFSTTFRSETGVFVTDCFPQDNTIAYVADVVFWSLSVLGVFYSIKKIVIKQKTP